jgi:hypothetical protein
MDIQNLSVVPSFDPSLGTELFCKMYLYFALCPKPGKFVTYILARNEIETSEIPKCSYVKIYR